MSENNETPTVGPGSFVWNELISTDTEASTKFYTGLFGWKAEAFPNGMDYTLFTREGAEKSQGGMMKAPVPGMPAHWLPYVLVEDVDASAAKAAELGGKVMAPPFDIPTVGRIAVILDPQGAAMGIIKPSH